MGRHKLVVAVVAVDDDVVMESRDRMQRSRLIVGRRIRAVAETRAEEEEEGETNDS